MYIRMTFHRRSMCKCDGILCCPPLHRFDILCAEEGELRFLCVTRISQSDCSRDPLIGGRSRMCAYRRNCRRSNGCVLNTRDSNPFEITIMLGGHCGQWLRYTRNTGLIPFVSSRLRWVASAHKVTLHPEHGTRSFRISRFTLGGLCSQGYVTPESRDSFLSDLVTG